MDKVEISIEDARKIVEHCDRISFDIDGVITRIPEIKDLRDKITQVEKGSLEEDIHIKYQFETIYEKIDELEDESTDTFEYHNQCITELQGQLDRVHTSISDIISRIQKLERKDMKYCM